MNSVFPGYSVDERASIEKPDISEFQLHDLSWLSFGTMICSMYEKFEGETAISYDFTLDEFLVNSDPSSAELSYVSNGPKIVDVINEKQEVVGVRPTADGATESKDNSNSTDVIFLVPSKSENQTSADVSAAEDSDAGGSKVSDPAESTKPRQARRRGSDLSFLEQWGWHKNKRYAQRKKSHDRNDPDTTVNGVLRKILAKYFE